MSIFLDRWKKQERFFFLLTIAGAMAVYFLLILLMEFQLGDDLQAISLARKSSFTDIFTSSVYNWGEYYRPLILFVAKLSLTPSFSVLPFRIGLALTGLAIFALAILSVRNLGVSLFGVALAVFFLIGSPFTHGTFTWWADMGGRHVVLGFMVAAYFITAGKRLPWLVAFPVLAFCLLSQEAGLAIALLYFCTFLVWRDYRGAAGILLLLVAYFALRFAVLGAVFSQKGLFLQLPQGFFFTNVTSKEQWQGMFGGRYHLLYVYNIFAQFFAVFFAEPNSGLLSFSQWRHVLPFIVQTASTVILCTVLLRKADHKILLIVGLFLLAIIANVFIGFGSARFRTIAMSGTAYMILFVWAADMIWRSLRSGSSRWPRWSICLVLALFFGWGGQAALRILDMGHGVRNQGRAYFLTPEPPDSEIDADLYWSVKQKYVEQ